ncbi:MAG: shikimate dehydrogenase [Pseudomonadota bacterium]
MSQGAASAPKFAVLGNPVRHSRSPWIHAAFAEQCGLPMQYRAVAVEPDKFENTVIDFFARGGKGLNITVPFKQKAFALAERLSERARVAGAVNTLLQREQQLVGDNTDGIGLVRDMVANLGWQVRDRRLLVMGAGGAVRGVLELLLKEHPSALTVVNRSADKAVALAQDFAELGRIDAGGYELIADADFDLVINGTSASLSGELPPLPSALLNDRSCCYDMMYSAEPTPFMRWAAQHTAWAVADGLGMLVEQAAESFYLWQGVRPQTGPVLAALRNRLAGGST